MGLKLAADFDLELFFSEAEKRMAKWEQKFDRYLTKPHADIRQLFGHVEAGTSPVVINLGAPGGGLLWSVQQVVLMTGVALSTVAVANVAAGIFVGSVPTAIGQNLEVGSLVANNLTVPANYQAGGKSIVCRSQQSLYVVLQGAGTSGSSWSATATVLQVPDTSEALLWL